MLSAGNQQERSRAIPNPWYIVGFVEGEGTFHVAFYRDPKMKQSVKVIPEFHVSQSYLRLETLHDIQRFFGCGYLKRNHPKNPRDTTYVYVVRNRNDLEKYIIPFFKRYSLRSTKQQSFQLFAQIVGLMVNGKHRTRSGLRQIITLAYRMNVNGKYRQRRRNDVLTLSKSSETIR